MLLKTNTKVWQETLVTKWSLSKNKSTSCQPLTQVKTLSMQGKVFKISFLESVSSICHREFVSIYDIVRDTRNMACLRYCPCTHLTVSVSIFISELLAHVSHFRQMLSHRCIHIFTNICCTFSIVMALLQVLHFWVLGVGVDKLLMKC